MEKFINPEDNYLKSFKISLHNYDNEWFYVYASHEQDALDVLVDHLEKKRLTGFFLEKEDREEHLEDEGYYIVAGNHCLYLDPEHTHIEQC